MEQAGFGKDIALLFLGIVSSTVPWLLDKLDIRMPKPFSYLLLCTSIVIVWWSLYKLNWLEHIPLVKGKEISLADAVLAATAIGFLLIVIKPVIWKDQTGLISTPTYVRLQFNESGTYPIIIDQKNMFRNTWFSYHVEDATAQKILGTSWMIFLVFDKPIDVKEIMINGNGRKLPPYEVKDRTVRSAVIFFQDDVVNTVLSINVKN